MKSLKMPILACHYYESVTMSAANVILNAAKDLITLILHFSQNLI